MALDSIHSSLSSPTPMFVQVARQYRVNTHTKENSLAPSNSSIAARIHNILISVHVAGLIHPLPLAKERVHLVYKKNIL